VRARLSTAEIASTRVATLDLRVTLALFAALAIGCKPSAANPFPTKLAECESKAGCGGEWTFSGREGKAQWPNGVEADLLIERFDEQQVLIRRTDTSRLTTGITAVYAGKVNGKHVEGDATFSWPGHWNQPVVVEWIATIEDEPRRSGIPAITKLSECETHVCGGDWRFSGRDGMAYWPNGVQAELSIERFDDQQVLIRRTDISRITQGMTVVYAGKVNGRRLEGDATYSWPGHWNQPVVVQWSASIEDQLAASAIEPAAHPAAQPATAPARTSPASTEDAWIPQKRLALIIGNSRYTLPGTQADASTWPDLEEGPIKDADAMAARLRSLGFDVVEAKNQTIDQMNADLRAFGDRIAAAPDSLALFYYSGHGARAPRDIGDEAEETYLIPVGTNLQYDVDAHSKAVGLIEVSNLMRRSRAGVVILDACRNNALRRPSARAAVTRGLAAPENISGMLFAYSTPAGDVADNRPGKTSEYTELLIGELGVPGQSLTGSFRKVRKQIAQVHNSRLPELTDQLNDDIVLVSR